MLIITQQLSRFGATFGAQTHLLASIFDWATWHSGDEDDDYESMVDNSRDTQVKPLKLDNLSRPTLILEGF